jgi:preprotein translocase subunit YajC
MSLLIADAHAQGAGGAAPPGLDLIFLVLLFVVFYFLLIRPQMKRAKEHRTMVAALSKGDEVVTNGGLLGRITKVGESFVSLEVADGLEVRVQKQALANLVPKGTMKSL